MRADTTEYGLFGHARLVGHAREVFVEVTAAVSVDFIRKHTAC